MPPVCKFWQQGSCRYGDQCRFEHPANRGFTNGNRFGALAETNSNPRNNNYQSGSSSSNRTLPYMLDKNAILTDLTSEKPQWILSAYGPGRNAPAQLFGGLPREQSFEEMRLLHYMGLASGNPQQAVQEADNLVQQSEQQIQTAVSNIDSAIQYLINAEKDHPNRIDICKGGQDGPGAQPNPLGGATPFGAPSQPAPAFGTPSTTSAFGAPGQPAPAFGAPSAPLGAFGQPSQLGQKPNPFGSSAPAFGAPSQPGNTGAFGQPSLLGQTQSPFGAPAATGGVNVFLGGVQNTFGQPSFGAPSQPGASNTFGAPSQAATSNPFGAPSQPVVSSPFGAPTQTAASSPFGAPSQPATSSPFGAPSQPSVSNAFGASSQPATSNPFGAPSQPASSNPFGAPSQPAAANPFGGPSNQSTFGAPSQVAQPKAFGASAAPFGNPTPSTSNQFGAPSQPSNPTPFGQPQPAVHPFGNTVPTGPAAAQSNAFGAQHTNGLTNGSIPRNRQDVNSYSTRDSNGRLLTWKNRRVVYKEETPGFTNQAGKWEKIWFPNGPPAPDKQAFLPAENYDQTTKEQYEYAKQHGKFKDGIMPLMPPLMEMCTWDF